MKRQSKTLKKAKQNTLIRINFFNRREMAELPKLLLPDEKLLAIVSGAYTAGTAILCVTSMRMLLVDKKMIRLNFEDVRFDSIREVNYSQQVFMASLRFYYAGREMQFRSWYKKELRELAQLVQEKMFEVREKKNNQQEPVMQQVPVQPLSEAIPLESPALFRVAAPASTVQREDYLNQRLEKWRQADRFVDKLAMSAKTGRQVLRLETEVRS